MGEENRQTHFLHRKNRLASNVRLALGQDQYTANSFHLLVEMRDRSSKTLDNAICAVELDFVFNLSNIFKESNRQILRKNPTKKTNG